MKLTEPQADVVWLALVFVCGACRDERDVFVHLAQETDPLEYRFQSDLGFGGKVYLESPPRVTCYKENETAARNRKIENVNELLRAIAKLW